MHVNHVNLCRYTRVCTYISYLAIRMHFQVLEKSVVLFPYSPWALTLRMIFPKIPLNLPPNLKSYALNPQILFYTPILAPTHRLHSSSCLGLPYKILNINLKKELLWSLYG